MNDHWEVYSLIDPRSLQTRYVGITSHPTIRYKCHLQQARKLRTHVQKWVYGLLRSGRKPIYLVLEYGNGTAWQDRERFWIAAHRKFCDLTNHTDGGDGTHGWIPSAETRMKMSAAHAGRRRSSPSSETRELLAAAARGNKRCLGYHHSQEARARMALAHQGNTNNLGHSPSIETREKLRAAQKGKRASPETLAKMRAYRASAETRAKLSKAGIGKHHSTITRAKIGAASKRYWENRKEQLRTNQ